MNTKKRKRMKLPNGFGSVVLRTDGNRRRPWSVKVTINGRQKSIGDTATEIEGLALLAEYHKNPSLFAPTLITFSEVFELMRAERFPKLAKTTQVNYLSAYIHCHRLYGKKFAELKSVTCRLLFVIHVIPVPTMPCKRRLDRYYIICTHMP